MHGDFGVVIGIGHLTVDGVNNAGRYVEGDNNVGKDMEVGGSHVAEGIVDNVAEVLLQCGELVASVFYVDRFAYDLWESALRVGTAGVEVVGGGGC